MDRTDRPDDARTRGGTGDAAGGEEPADAPDANGDGHGDGDDRSALHVASEGTSWRFSLDDLDEDRAPEPLTPGSPDPEHVAFVLLGAALTLFVFSRFLL